jgi:hypothetical protein
MAQERLPQAAALRGPATLQRRTGSRLHPHMAGARAPPPLHWSRGHHDHGAPWGTYPDRPGGPRSRCANGSTPAQRACPSTPRTLAAPRPPRRLPHSGNAGGQPGHAGHPPLRLAATAPGALFPTACAGGQRALGTVPRYHILVEAGACLCKGETPDVTWSTPHASLPGPSTP